MATRICDLSVAGILLMSLLVLGGCSHTIKDLCENCGVIRKITPRSVLGEPPAGARLPGGIIGSGSESRVRYGASSFSGGGNGWSPGSHTVYIVAVRMDWGGVEYFTVSSIDGLERGDRVQIEYGQIVPTHTRIGG